MDLNQLLYRHQVSLMRADDAVCTDARSAHVGHARGYADEIEQMRRAMGADSDLMGAA